MVPKIKYAYRGKVMPSLPTPLRQVEGGQLYLHSFLTKTLDGDEWSV